MHRSSLSYYLEGDRWCTIREADASNAISDSFIFTFSLWFSSGNDCISALGSPCYCFRFPFAVPVSKQLFVCFAWSESILIDIFLGSCRQRNGAHDSDRAQRNRFRLDECAWGTGVGIPYNGFWIGRYVVYAAS